MSKRYMVSVRVEPLEDVEGYLAICDDIPGCHAEGDTVAEAIENIQDVAKAILEFSLEKGLGLPEGLREAGPDPVEVQAQILVTVA